MRPPQLRGEIIEPVLVARHHDEVVTQCCELPGELGADPSRSPGDQSHHVVASTLFGRPSS
jgi:hypothetical protein